MVYPVRKVNIEDLWRENFLAETPTIYEILWGEVKYELLIHHIPGSAKMVALGTGTVSRDRGLPDFKRNSWYPAIPVTSIWYADPTLYTGELSLYWYYGNNRQWYLENIAFLLAYISDKLGLSLNDSLYFGSSGGGYASLVLAAMLHGKSLVINPQIILTDYYPDHVARFLQDVLREGEEILPERNNVVSLFKRERFIPRIHYVQNLQAKRDVRFHLTPFLRELSDQQMNCGEVISMEFYYDGGGHNAMPSQKKCLSLMRQVLADQSSGAVLETDGKGGASSGFFTRLRSIPFENPQAYLYLDTIDLTQVITHAECGVRDGVIWCRLIPLIAQTDGCLFAYYLQSGSTFISKLPYTRNMECFFPVPGPGTYRIKYFIRRGEEKISVATEDILV